MLGGIDELKNRLSREEHETEERFGEE